MKNMRDNSEHKILVIVPARSGSKGIPGKNTRDLFGKPLLAHAWDCAGKISKRHQVDAVLSTDSLEIAAIGEKIGIEVPFIRPASLAQDESPMVDVVSHVVKYLAQYGRKYDYIILLQPTSPFRMASEIDKAILTLIENKELDSVVSVEEVPKQYSPYYLMKIEDGMLCSFIKGGEKYNRRQDVPPAFTRNGQFYVFRYENLEKYNSIYGLKVKPFITNHVAVNLDSVDDWNQAEKMYDHFVRVTK